MRQTEKLKKIHAKALTGFDAVQSASYDMRKLCLTARRFVSIPGAQWEGALQQQFENKPKFEVNKVWGSVQRIFSEYRNNRVTVDFLPSDGSPDDKLADVCDGLFRADVEASGGQQAFDNAFEEGVSGGIGAWRLCAEYEDDEDEENDKQRIRFHPIYDADSSVYFDLDSKKQDKSDARECWVITSMSPDAYAEEWGEDPASFDKTISGVQWDWYSPDVVYIAEYYVMEHEKDEVVTFVGLDGQERKVLASELEEDEESDEISLAQELASTGFTETKRKPIKRKRCHKYILSGSRILEDCGIIAGNCIPIIPFYAKRWFIDNVERCAGHVQNAMDAQRLLNMQLSKLAEIAATSNASKPIFDPSQIASEGDVLSEMWRNDPIKNYPFLMAKALRNADDSIVQTGPVAYTQPPQVPPALAALTQFTAETMSEILGNQQAGEELMANTSGKAVELVQDKLDMQVFIYTDNFRIAMKRCGEVWLGMARDIYVEEKRKMKSIGRDESTSTIELVRPTFDAESGEITYENDLTKAKFDVISSVGPSSSSKRSATVRALTGMAAVSADPQNKAVLESLAMMNMEGEGLDDIRTYYRKKLIRMGAVKPNDQERAELAQEQQQQQPDPQAAYLMAEAQKSQAMTGKALADTELTKAKTVETLASLDMSRQKQAVDTAIQLQNAVNQPMQG
jgi:hypothetical protein